jgi:hypothetical protein
MLRHVALVRADVSEEHITYIITIKRISELETNSEVTSELGTRLPNYQLLVTTNLVSRALILFASVV